MPAAFTLPALPAAAASRGYGEAPPPASFAVVLGAVTEPPPRLAPLPLLLEAGLRSLGEGFGFPEVEAAEIEFEDLADADLAGLVPFPIIMPMPPPFAGQVTELSTLLEPVLDHAAPADLRTNLMFMDASIEVVHTPEMPMVTISQGPGAAAAVLVPSPVPADPIRDPGLVFEFPTFLPIGGASPASGCDEAAAAPLLAPQAFWTEGARRGLGEAGRPVEPPAQEAAKTSFDLHRVAAANGDFDETGSDQGEAGTSADSAADGDGSASGSAWAADQFQFVVNGALPVSTSELPLEKLAGVAGKIEALGEVQDAGARVGNRLTLRLDDALGHWEVDMVRHDELLQLVLRGDAELHQMVGEATPELRDRLAAEGLTLQRIDFAAPNTARGESSRAVESLREGEGANFGDTTHQHASHDGRREEAPAWPPAKARRAAIAGRVRDGLLNRAV